MLGGLARRVWGSRPGASAAAPTVPRTVATGLARRLDDVLRGRGTAFRQASSTTCGSSSLAMFRVLTDRDYADALLQGEPAEVARRWARLERAVQASTNTASSGSGLRLPWPIALGTPPWGLRDALDDLGRARGVRFEVTRVDGTRAGEVDAALARVDAAVARGIPVPVYVGNGLTPRHVVLAVASGPGWVDVYDPGHGGRSRVEREALRSGRARVSGWDLLWAVVGPR
ncbi:hypothetical protein GCM10028777_06440 [Angustibacter speluncae]